jgi:hypothetical protein
LKEGKRLSRVGEIVTINKELFNDVISSYYDKENAKDLTHESKFEVIKYNQDWIYPIKASSVDYPNIIVDLKEIEINELVKAKNDTYEDKGRELGALVDTKQAAYGNAIAQTYEVVKAFMTPYFDEKTKTYTIPQSLLQHLLLQVRIIDKQNRIFNNPNGDLMSESPYGDLGGYGLLGANMVIDK